jgi:cell division protein FtsW
LFKLWEKFYSSQMPSEPLQQLRRCEGSGDSQKLGEAGRLLLATTLLLVMTGLIMVYAASALKGEQQFNDAFMFIRKQGLVALAGFGLMYGVTKVPMKYIERSAMPLLGITMILLSLILVPGVYKSGGGAARWISFAGFRFQTSEFAKLALVFFLAKNLARRGFDIHSLKTGIAPNIIIFAGVAVFMMLQPDFGSTVLMGLVLFSMLFVAGLDWRYILSAAVAAIVAIVGAIFVAPYRLARLTSFLDPWAEIKRGGFQIIQSYLAFQNGGLLGLGLGESRQKLFFLPEAHTDFILAVLAEELGFLGVTFMCLAFAYYCFLGFRIAFLQGKPFQRYLAFGLTATIGFQGAINMSVAMGLLPTKGIPLPFISSGASSLLMSLTTTALLLRLSIDETRTHNR